MYSVSVMVISHRLEYIPRFMLMVMLCSVLLWFMSPILPISFMVASLALGQSFDCPSASEATLKDMAILQLDIVFTFFKCLQGNNESLSEYSFCAVLSYDIGES